MRIRGNRLVLRQPRIEGSWVAHGFSRGERDDPSHGCLVLREAKGGERTVVRDVFGVGAPSFAERRVGDGRLFEVSSAAQSIPHPFPTKRMGRRGGFTYLEMLVVLIVMSVLASIAVPRYAQFTARQRVEAAARRLIADLSYARSLAKTTSKSVTVAVSVGRSDYTLRNVPDPDRAGDYTVHLQEEPYQATIRSCDLGGDTDVIFDGYGIPDAGGTITVQVGSYNKTISVDAESGRASTQDGIWDIENEQSGDDDGDD